MLSFLSKRLAQTAVVLLVVSFIAFLMFNYVGDPVSALVPEDMPLAERQQLREQLGLEDPLIVQYGRFLGRVLEGNLGRSYQLRRPVSELIAERLPATLELSFVSMALAILVGVPAGVYAALRPGALASRLTMGIALVGVSLPTFVIALLLVAVFSVNLGWFPSFGRGRTHAIGFWVTGLLTPEGWRAIVLPAVTLALFQLALIIRLIRSEMGAVLRADFIKFAWARGLSPAAVHFGHALPNALVPVVTIVGLQLGAVIAFSVITESMFQWPGVGLLFIQAVNTVDIPVMSGYLLVVAVIYSVLNLGVDLLYRVIDPRMRTKATGGGHAG